MHLNRYKLLHAQINVKFSSVYNLKNMCPEWNFQQVFAENLPIIILVWLP